MMKITLTAIIFYITIVSFSQSTFILVIQNEKAIGKNLIRQNVINAKEYIFPDRIENSYIDTIDGVLTIQLRGLSENQKWLNNKGSLVLYDLTNNNVKWSKTIFFQTSNIQQFNNIIIHSFGNKSYCLNIDNGENLWEIKNNIYFFDPIEKIGLGYKFKSSTGYTNTLEGINLRTGKVIWQKELNREFSWNDVFYLNDSTVIVVAAGLHAINIKNGTGWDYNTVTGKKDYSETIATNALGAVLGLLTGTFIISTGSNLVRDIVSNVITDSSCLYFASKEKISRIDRSNGNSNWSYPIFNDAASKSSLFIKDSLLFMVNYGYAYMGYRQLDYGTPFIAAFNKENGTQKFFSFINTNKKPIVDFQIKNNSITLVCKDKLSIYSLLDGSMIFDTTFSSAKYGEINYFIGDQIFIKTKDSLLTSLPLLDTTKTYLLTNEGKALVIDDGQNIIEQINFDKLYIYYLGINNLKFLANGNQTIVLNKDNTIIAEINISRNAFLIGNKLYDIQEKSFLEIDISELIEDE